MSERHCLKGCAAGHTDILSFRKADEAVRSCNSKEFLHDPWPGRPPDDGQKACVDQVKEVVWVIEWVKRIHPLKAGVLQLAHACLRGGILGHLRVDVEAHHLQMRIGSCHFEHPAAWSTGRIKCPLKWHHKFRLVSVLRQDPTQGF